MCQQNCHFQKNPWKHHLRPRHIKATEARPANLEEFPNNWGSEFVSRQLATKCWNRVFLGKHNILPGILSLPTKLLIMSLHPNSCIQNFRLNCWVNSIVNSIKLCRLKAAFFFFGRVFLLVKILKNCQSDPKKMCAHLVGLDKIAWNNSKWWPGWSSFSNEQKNIPHLHLVWSDFTRFTRFSGAMLGTLI